MRIFPRIVPPTVSRPLWLVATIVVLVLWHHAIWSWASDGPAHAVIQHLAELKLVVAVVVVVLGGGLRLLRRTVAARAARSSESGA